MKNNKRTIFLLITILIGLLSVSCRTYTRPDILEFKKFETIEFGGYEWFILEKQENMVLIISKDILFTLHVDNHIRGYLNNDFYNSFSYEERERIIEVTNINPNNPYYGTSGGPDTIDKIFLLSVQEVVKYFGDSGKLNSLQYYDDPYDLTSGPVVDDQFNLNRVAFKGNRDDPLPYYNQTWLLRTPGRGGYSYIYISHRGWIYLKGQMAGGIRPALWLNL